ncbi:MAG: NAAT family transporter [Burkholderiales bacterium]|jgi:multiple antibiotic resistance protein|nr:NAAT family transporter [Burkholderiales bacterium]MCX7204398.1 NAAT family transporter [Pseudomonadota bacterium]
MLQTLTVFFGNMLLVFGALMPILNPPGHAPMFLTLTANYNSQERVILARRVGIYSFILLLVSMFIGSYVLEFFGVSLPIVQVGGGLLVATAGWQLMSSGDDGHKAAGMEHVGATRPSNEELRERAFYPLTFPITVGPGSITVAIALGAGFNGPGLQKFSMPLASLTAVAITSYSLYLCYRHAERLLKLLGSTGSVIFLRLSAFILMCIGIQIFWDGFSVLFGTLLSKSLVH